MPQAWFKLHPQVSKYSTSLKLGTELSSTKVLGFGCFLPTCL